MYSFEMKRSILNQQYLAALRQIAVVFLTNWNTMAPFSSSLHPVCRSFGFFNFCHTCL